MHILFLGDSITDCDHCFTRDNLGTGFVKYIAARYNASVTNGGADGSTFPRIYRKWQQEYANRHFDIAVITGGINEVGVLMNTGLSVEQSEEYLRQSMRSLHSLLRGLSDTQVGMILLLEPFLFPVPGYRCSWYPCLEKVRQQIRRTASGFPGDAVQLLDVQKSLDLLSARKGISSVTTDGIHLTMEGHLLLASLVLAHFPKT